MILILFFILKIPASFIETLLGLLIDAVGWSWFFLIGSCLSLLGWIIACFFNVKIENNTKNI
jgi:hypothetical protein